MNALLNRIVMYPQPMIRSNSPDRRKMSKLPTNEPTIVWLRNKQINECVDTVSFSGLVNR